MPHVHPAAVIDPAAALADDVRVGPFAVIEGPVTLGPGCTVAAHAHLIGPLTAGANNKFHSGCVIGDAPQHLAYTGDGTTVEVGDGNTFREHTTVHRGTAPGTRTVVGSGNLFMAGAHVAHDCRVGDRCTFANAALLAGHCEVGDGAFVSGNSAVHQFVRVGRLSMVGGVSACTRDLPPFLSMRGYNEVYGVNVVGLRRAGVPRAEIDGVRQAYRALFLRGHLVPESCRRIEAELGHLPAVAELLAFVRASKRGIAVARSHDLRAEAA